MLNGTPRNMSAERWYSWQDSRCGAPEASGIT